MASNSILISPSLLACDFGKLADEAQKAEAAGADWLHVDVMDGHFVPNLTMGPVIVDALKKATKLPLDVHLMIEHPEQYVQAFKDSGADYLTVHVEATGMCEPAMLRRTLEAIHAAGMKTGASVRPKTGLYEIKSVLKDLDLVLVMTVEPGFGGQKFIAEAVPKITELRKTYAGRLSVDGGINAETGKICRDAGADVLVAGTYVFRSPSYEQAIQSLRG